MKYCIIHTHEATDLLVDGETTFGRLSALLKDNGIDEPMYSEVGDCPLAEFTVSVPVNDVTFLFDNVYYTNETFNSILNATSSTLFGTFSNGDINVVAYVVFNYGAFLPALKNSDNIIQVYKKLNSIPSYASISSKHFVEVSDGTSVIKGIKNVKQTLRKIGPMKNVFWFSNLNQIGGTETFLYYLARKYSDWDITIYYNTADPLQLCRLSKYCRCVKYNGGKIKCDRVFLAYSHDIIDNVEANEYCFISHIDYKARKVKPPVHPKITKYYGVSQAVCDSWKEITGIDMECLYLPIVLDEPKRVLHLISATRLTDEKGGWRMKRLADLLDSKGISYTWSIYTNKPGGINSKNVVYRQPRLDLIDFIAEADYLVQLSDSESYCYSVAEALSVGTPVIVTDIPALKEIGVEDHKNGFILDFDMNHIPLDDILSSELKFTYEPPKELWNTALAEGQSTYDPEKEGVQIKVKPIQNYYDMELKKNLTIGTPPFSVSFERAKYLTEKGLVKFV